MTDILESINRIQEYTADIEITEFLGNSEKQDAVIRRIEIIGEAAGKISLTIREKYSEVPWRQIIGIRNIAIHHYFGVSPELIWQVATKDAAELKPIIEKAIKDISQLG